jgi:hypothetical protein
MIVVLLSACALSVGFALASGAGFFEEDVDADADGVADLGDNCLGLVNPSQRDDDGYGNLCDTDINQDCNTGVGDLATVFGEFGTASPWSPKNLGAHDVNEDNSVGAADLASVFGKFGNPPGPSGKVAQTALQHQPWAWVLACALNPGSGLRVRHDCVRLDLTSCDTSLAVACCGEIGG